MARPKKVVPAPAAASKAAPKTEAPAPAPEKKPAAVTVYAVNMASDEEHAEKKPVKAESVGGVIVGLIHDMSSRGQLVTKAAILEEFRASEKAGSLRAAQWQLKPQEYVNGYVDWLKGNRSLVSEKAQA